MRIRRKGVYRNHGLTTLVNRNVEDVSVRHLRNDDGNVEAIRIWARQLSQGSSYDYYVDFPPEELVRIFLEIDVEAIEDSLGRMELKEEVVDKLPEIIRALVEAGVQTRYGDEEA